MASSSQASVHGPVNLSTGIELTERKSAQYTTREILEPISDVDRVSDDRDDGEDATRSTRNDRYNMERLGERISPRRINGNRSVDNVSSRATASPRPALPPNGDLLLCRDGHFRLGVWHLLDEPRLDRWRARWTYLVYDHPCGRVRAYRSLYGRDVLDRPNSWITVSLGVGIRTPKMAKDTELLHRLDFDYRLAGRQRHWCLPHWNSHSDHHS